MVYRLYVEKKPGLALEAEALLSDLRTFLGIGALSGLRILNRYDVEHIDPALFDACKKTVFSEPQLDMVYEMLPDDADAVFAVEYLPGQFDQRADSAAQCIQIISQGERPAVRTARVYLLSGALSAGDVQRVKQYVINPVEAREASFAEFATLEAEKTEPEGVERLRGFTGLTDAELDAFRQARGLAMGTDDLILCRDYFTKEGRDPTETEIRVIDTYWSDHCRHTTFLTTLDRVTFEDPLLERAWVDYLGARASIGRKKPVNLMDIGTLAAKVLRAEGRLDKLDESEEINACTVRMKVDVDGEAQDWLLLFKNETHNHPTEIEPFGGAATCIGGAIRDPLSGRAYVYAAMRVTGAADPLRPVSETIKGKLPQRKLTATAAAGYSSYGNQIGLATGQVDELYHDGYAAKRMEIGAVIAAVPAKNVRRERPEPGDAVILLGGRTGRDGCGGATGSSKSHDIASLETCGAEVQKGNAPEERKLQRLFRNPEASRFIRRCNDFGAGGVSVAVGELADGLDIDLDTVPKKYEGLSGTELAISESQERMAVVTTAADAASFLRLAAQENLEATLIARVKAEGRLTMRFKGETIVDLSRAFLDTNGAEKHAEAIASAPENYEKPAQEDFSAGLAALASDLNACSRRGLSERFDSTIGAGTVLMPFGGKNQLTPIQAMANKISLEKGKTESCSFMAWGFNPYISEKSPYHGAYLAVVESVSKLVASGAAFGDVYLTFQEYFEKLGSDPKRWGKPVSALLGAFEAQRALGIAAIGGKDSMSGSFMDMDVPPTLVSFAVTTGRTADVVSPEFKAAGHRVVLLRPEYDENGLPTGESLKALYDEVTALIRAGKAVSAWTPGFGGIAEGIMKMCFGNGVGFAFYDNVPLADIFGYAYGAFILELTEDTGVGVALGVTTKNPEIFRRGETLPLSGLLAAYEAKLEPVFPSYAKTPAGSPPVYTFAGPSAASSAVRTAKPKVLIPVFPGTNCEYDSARAFTEAGAEPRIFVVRNLTAEAIARSVGEFAAEAGRSEIIFIPGGFSGGDEPDGSGKFITAFFRNGAVKEAVTELLDVRGGLIGGICNGFQALIKLGLVPYGKIVDTDENDPTLTYNGIGRHQSRLVRVRVASNRSPWLAETKPGDIYTVPISHGEGRFLASDALIGTLAGAGQIATQYVDAAGLPTYDIRFNPNGSAAAVEGITSPDGRVFGKMGHAERIGPGLYKNVPGSYDMGLFRSAVKFFK
jgi:phosphoribosylformylglycinamidine synthase